MHTARHKKQISRKQVELLAIVWKYRFATRQVVMDVLGTKTGSTVFERLEVLVSYGLLAKRYENMYTLRQIPAYYYLTPDGLRMLRKQSAEAGVDSYVDDAMIRASYKDPTASMAFMVRCVDIAIILQLLMTQYPRLKTYTKRSLANFSYFPKVLPDAYLSMEQQGSAEPQSYFLEYVPASTDIRDVRTRLRQYREYNWDGDWSTTEAPHPVHLFIFETERQAKLLRRKMWQMVYSLEAQDLLVYTVVLPLLKSDGQAWLELGARDGLVRLDAIPLSNA